MDRIEAREFLYRLLKFQSAGFKVWDWDDSQGKVELQAPGEEKRWLDFPQAAEIVAEWFSEHEI